MSSSTEIQVKEPYEEMNGYVKATHWSIPYFSPLSFNNPKIPWHLLSHINCSYMSTPGRPPTLLALKQHAQSLSVLISMLAPSQNGAEIDNENSVIQGDATFAKNQAFDWLNNLQQHYITEDASHQKPLNALVNLIDSNHDDKGTVWHCPLNTCEHKLAEKSVGQQYRPFQTHMTLLMHANECLERLDHEYSALGGILSIIPLDNEKAKEREGLDKAKTTLVGQWVLYTQHLAARMHELEIAYANSLDLLQGEALVPMQHISAHGPDGRSGREIVFPQDRWILANAGEDVYSFIQQMLDKREAQQDDEDKVFHNRQVMGDSLLNGIDDLRYRGIVKVDLNTRFYRLRGSGHGPLFVLPAYADRANTEYTRDLENRPTVVTIPTPAWPSGVSAWDKKHRDIEQERMRLASRVSHLSGRVDMLQAQKNMYENETKMLRTTLSKYESDGTRKDLEDKLNDCGAKTQQLQEHMAALGDADAAAKAVADLTKANEALEWRAKDAEMINKLLRERVDKDKEMMEAAANQAVKDLKLPFGTPVMQEDHSTVLWCRTSDWTAVELGVRAAREAQGAANQVYDKLAALVQAGHLAQADIQWVRNLKLTALDPQPMHNPLADIFKLQSDVL